MSSSTQDLIFLLPVSVISPLIGIVINESLPCKAIITWLPATGLPQLSSVITCAIESFLSVYLSPDQDLLTNFSFLFWMEKKKRNFLALHPGHPSAESPPCLVPIAPLVSLLSLKAPSSQQGQTRRCLSHLRASFCIPSLAVTLLCLYPACLLIICAMMFCGNQLKTWLLSKIDPLLQAP